ncbi:uncharacterized protein LOC108675951, partial [Hyalella azteca]|uniref:Uncharacterized protein LOC108675951 n=1 Tax=Hyalella azteca TaxID=294128 RepID=A0A979FP82_HYAAZ
IRSLGKLRTWDYILLGKEAVKLGYNKRAIQWFKLAVKNSDTEELTDEEREIITGLRSTILKYESMALEDKSKKKKKKSKKSKGNSKEYMPTEKVLLTYEEEAKMQNKLCRGENLRL